MTSHPPTYTLGHHPRRTDHPALLDAAGNAVATFALGATRAEITANLASGGFTFHDDDTVTATPAQPAPSRRSVITRIAAAIAGVAVLAGPARATSQDADADAELMLACGRFIELDEAYSADLLWADVLPGQETPESKASQERSDAFARAEHELGEWMANTPARTAAGQQRRPAQSPNTTPAIVSMTWCPG